MWWTDKPASFLPATLNDLPSIIVNSITEASSPFISFSLSLRVPLPSPFTLRRVLVDRWSLVGLAKNRRTLERAWNRFSTGWRGHCYAKWHLAMAITATDIYIYICISWMASGNSFSSSYIGSTTRVRRNFRQTSPLHHRVQRTASSGVERRHSPRSGRGARGFTFCQRNLSSYTPIYIYIYFSWQWNTKIVNRRIGQIRSRSDFS